MRRRRWMATVLVAMNLGLAGCTSGLSAVPPGGPKIEPAQVKVIPGKDVKQVTLTQRASQRVGIATVAIGVATATPGAGGQQGTHLARFGLAVHRGAELGRRRQALGVPAEMLACHAHAGLGAIVRKHGLEVGADGGVLLGQRRIDQPLAGAEVMHDLLRKPGPPISAAADHQAIGP